MKAAAEIPHFTASDAQESPETTSTVEQLSRGRRDRIRGLETVALFAVLGLLIRSRSANSWLKKKVLKKAIPANEAISAQNFSQ